MGTPILVVSNTSWPSRDMPDRKVWAMRPARAAACRWPVRSSPKTTNSSPPTRATVSSVRRYTRSHVVTSTSSRSPPGDPGSRWRAPGGPAARRSWEVGEGIVQHLVLQSLLQGSALGNIRHHSVPVERVALLVPHQHHLVAHPHGSTVAGDQTVLHIRTTALVGTPILGQHALAVIRMEDLE
jgi:hypothetical protein